jgi:pyruvate dehydrogenase E2 component (dihydrolipoamide acetyltransferase)
MGTFTMPSLGADMEAGTLVEWLVKQGDRVARGDVVAVVETQKGAIEIEIFEAGVIDALLASSGDKLPVGAPLLLIREAGGEAAPVPSPGPKPALTPLVAPTVAAAEIAASPPTAAQVAPAPAEVQPMAGMASPAARARAAEAGISLTAVPGSGPGGAVVLADVEAVLSRAAPAARSAKPGLDPTAMRAAIAAAMARSKREIPHYYLWQDIDLQPATDWLAATNTGRVPDGRLLMGTILVKAVALAARAVPEMNGYYEAAGFRPVEGVHVGLAVSLRGGGLIAPAIRDADRLTLDALMAAMRDLVARVRSGRLRSSEMTDATLTLSSMGDARADGLLGVIYPPQVALAGFGTPRLRPWPVQGEVALRTIITASLAADHRVSDGRHGARFLAEVARHLKEPALL